MDATAARASASAQPAAPLDASYSAWWNARMLGYDRIMAWALTMLTLAAWWITTLFPSTCGLNLSAHLLLNFAHLSLVHLAGAALHRRRRTLLILPVRALYVAAALLLHPTCQVNTRALQGQPMQRAAFALGITTLLATAATMPLPLPLEAAVQVASTAVFATRVSWACAIVARLPWLSELMQQQVALVQRLAGHVLYLHGCTAAKAYGLPRMAPGAICEALGAYLLLAVGLALPLLAACVAHHASRRMFRLAGGGRGAAAGAGASGASGPGDDEWSAANLAVLLAYGWVLCAALAWLLMTQPWPSLMRGAP
jgi:hypothetical protein